MRNVLIDDGLLKSVLRQESLTGVPRRASLHTTGLWYFRLCSAYFGETSGVLSRPFLGLPEDRRIQAESQLLELPDSIGLMSLRTLSVSMGHLRHKYSELNLLALEVLAGALALNADVFASTRSPHLEEALAHEGKHYEILK